MAHIPMEDIRQLWDQTPQHSWQAFHKTLEAHKDKAQGISNTLILAMLRFTEHLEHSNRPYPESVDEMYSLMNKDLEQFAAQHPAQYRRMD